MAVGPRGEQQGPEANIATQQIDLKELQAEQPAQPEAAAEAPVDKKAELRKKQEERAKALGQKLSSAGRGLGGMFGGLMGKLKDVGLSLFTPVETGKAVASATGRGIAKVGVGAAEGIAGASLYAVDKGIDAANAVGRGIAKVGVGAAEGIAGASLYAVDKGIDAANAAGRGIAKVGVGAAEGIAGASLYAVDKSIDAANAVGRGARNLAEGALVGTVAAGVETVVAADEYLVQPGIKMAKDAWKGGMERGGKLVDSLSKRKDSLVAGFLNWNAKRLENKALKGFEKWKATDNAAQEAARRAEFARAQKQAETLKSLDNAQLDEAAAA